MMTPLLYFIFPMSLHCLSIELSYNYIGFYVVQFLSIVWLYLLIHLKGYQIFVNDHYIALYTRTNVHIMGEYVL